MLSNHYDTFINTLCLLKGISVEFFVFEYQIDLRNKHQNERKGVDNKRTLKQRHCHCQALDLSLLDQSWWLWRRRGSLDVEDKRLRDSILCSRRDLLPWFCVFTVWSFILSNSALPYFLFVVIRLPLFGEKKRRESLITQAYGEERVLNWQSRRGIKRFVSRLKRRCYLVLARKWGENEVKWARECTDRLRSPSTET